MARYNPGICNIGNHEKEKRLYSTYIFAALTILFLALFYLVSYYFVIPLAICIYITTLSYMQYQSNFCIYYGITNKMSFDTLGVMNANPRDLDRNFYSSISYMIYAFIISLIILLILLMF